MQARAQRVLVDAEDRGKVVEIVALGVQRQKRLLLRIQPMPDRREAVMHAARLRDPLGAGLVARAFVRRKRHGEPTAAPPRAVDEAVIQAAHEPRLGTRDCGKLGKSCIGLEADVLHQVFGIGTAPRQAQRRAVQRREMRLDQAGEPLLERIAHRDLIVPSP